MKPRPLGRTGLQVSPIGFGCGPTAGLMLTGTAAQRRDAVACALDSGINYFDTAPGYGDAVSESNLGEVLSELKARPHVATKVALSFDELDAIAPTVERSVEASLRRLRVNELAVIQLHNRIGARRAPKASFGTGAVLSVEDVQGPEGVVATLQRLRQRGLVRAFGCTAFGGDADAVRTVIDSDAFEVLSIHYSLLNESAFKAGVGHGDRDYAGLGAHGAARGMGLVALRVLEGGALAQSANAAIRFALGRVEVSTVLIGFSDTTQVLEAVKHASSGG